MSKKTIGRQYFITNEDGIQYKRGLYFFGKYCESCTRKVYLSQYEAQEFVYHATPHLDKRKWWVKLLKKIPRLKLVVEKNKGVEEVFEGK